MAAAATTPSTDDNYAEAVRLVQEWVDAGDVEAFLEFDKPLDHLPPLPSNLKKLRIVYGTLDEHTVLPDGLSLLVLDYCSVGNVHWPPRLNRLNIGDSDALTLSVLPGTLECLVVEDVRRLTFGSALPSALGSLVICNCRILERGIPERGIPKLPPLPSSLRMLTASSCGLKTLPRAFPSTLRFVDLENNKIRRLPHFSSALETLEVRRNNLPLPQETFELQPATYGSPLRAYLRDLYALQDTPGEIPIWGEDGQVNVDDVADPYGEECWDTEGDI
jgi:Leucine-rich repeat (LRR) protein